VQILTAIQEAGIFEYDMNEARDLEAVRWWLSEVTPPFAIPTQAANRRDGSGGTAANRAGIPHGMRIFPRSHSVVSLRSTTGYRL